MAGKAGIGAGHEEPISYMAEGYVGPGPATGAGQVVYQPLIQLDNGRYVIDTEALQIFNFLNSLDQDNVSNIMHQLGIDFDKIRGNTQYEKLMEFMVIVIRDHLKNKLRVFENDIFDDSNINLGRTNLKEQELSLMKLRGILDKEAEKKVKLRMWLLVAVSILFWLFILFLIWRLGWDIMEPWTYVIGVSVLTSQYLYFAITQRDMSPQVIYKRLLENEKRKKYQYYGLIVQS